MLAQAAGIWLADQGWLAAPEARALAWGALGAAAWPRLAQRLRAACALAAALFAGALALALQLESAARARPARPFEVVLEGTLVASSSAPAFARADLARVVAVENGAPAVPERVRILLSRGENEPASALEAMLPGERLRARVRLRAPGSLRNPGAPARERELARAGVGALGALTHPSLCASLPQRAEAAWLRPLWRLRAKLSRELAARGPDAALLLALGLGERGMLAPELNDAFARLGISHLLSISGLHLTLLASGAFLAARAALRRSTALAASAGAEPAALVLGVACALLYALLSGWAVPVRRSLVFLLALAAAAPLARPLPRLQPLWLAALAVLAGEPEALFDVSAQLSFAACAGLALTQPAPVATLAARAARLAGAAGRSLALSLAAVAATAPIAALALGRLAPLGVLANLIAIPWTAVALLPASLAACAAPLLPQGPLREAILRLAELVAGASARAVELVAAHAPQAERAGAPALAWLLAAGLLLGLGLRARSLALRALALAAELAVLGLAPPAPVAPAAPRLVAIDVGQGDATLVQGGRAALLVDAGTALEGGLDLGERAVVPTLRALGVARLDLVAVTHADLDHRGGIPALLERIPVAELWLPFGASREPAWDALRAAARRRGVPVRERGAGSAPLAVGDLRIAPLWPPPLGEAASRNDRSLVLRVEVQGRRVLLTGDLEVAGERALVASGVDLRADVLKLGHHGSRSSSGSAFLAAVGAELAVGSAACGGRFGMPHSEALARARAAGLPVWWTGRHGAVLVGLGAPLWVRAFGEDRPSCAPPVREGALRLRAAE